MIRHLREFKTQDAVAAMAVSGDGSLIAVGTGTEIELIEVDTGEQVRPIRTEEAATGLAISTDKRRLAVATGAPTVCVYDSGSGELVHRLIRSTVPDFLRERGQFQVAFLPGSTKLITLSGGTSDVTFWNCESGAWDHLVRMPQSNGAIEVSPDGNHIAIVGDPVPNAYQGQVTKWRVHQGLQAGWNNWHDGEAGISSAAFSPTSERLATCGSGDGIRVWSVASGEPLARVDAPQPNQFRGVVFVEDDQHLLTLTSRTLEVRRLDQEGGVATATSRQPGNIRGFGSSVDGTLVVTFNAGAALDAWRVDASIQDPD